MVAHSRNVLERAGGDRSFGNCMSLDVFLITFSHLFISFFFISLIAKYYVNVRISIEYGSFSLL